MARSEFQKGDVIVQIGGKNQVVVKSAKRHFYVVAIGNGIYGTVHKENAARYFVKVGRRRA